MDWKQDFETELKLAFPHLKLQINEVDSKIEIYINDFSRRAFLIFNELSYNETLDYILKGVSLRNFQVTVNLNEIPFIFYCEGKALLVSESRIQHPDQFETVSEWFKNLTSIELPENLANEITNFIGDDVWSNIVMERKKIGGFPHGLIFPDVPKYKILGFMGHGVNSYAIYYTRKETDGSIITLREPFGGAYRTNSLRDAKNALLAIDIANDLFDFAQSKGVQIEIRSNMGENWAIFNHGGEKLCVERNYRPLEEWVKRIKETVKKLAS